MQIFWNFDVVVCEGSASFSCVVRSVFQEGELIVIFAEIWKEVV